MLATHVYMPRLRLKFGTFTVPLAVPMAPDLGHVQQALSYFVACSRTEPFLGRVPSSGEPSDFGSFVSTSRGTSGLN